MVIISQPIPGPITGQSSPAPPVLTEKPDPTTANSNLQTEVVLEINQVSIDLDESLEEVTSLPVAHDQPTSENTGVPVTAREDTPSPEEDQSVVVVSILLYIYIYD